MKLRELTILGSLLAAPAAAHAGGLFLPGSGAISTSRAGAAVASADDGEALGINPAGLAKTRGTTITLSASLIQYSMKFTRSGTYDAVPDNMDSDAYEGTAFATVENKPELPLGIGTFQPIPVIAVATDLGGSVPNLRLAAGIYAPNAYPFRNMGGDYAFNGNFTTPPPATRYDVIEQDGAVILPSIAASYRITPQLDVGLRLTWGIATLKSTVALWGSPDNYEEDVKRDGVLIAEVSDSFVPMGGVGVTYRPTPSFELAATWSSMGVIQAKGTGESLLGPVAATLGGMQVSIRPSSVPRCAPGGTADALKTCVSLQLPMNATVGGRYKLLDGSGALKGDVELNVGWENWGKRCDFIADPSCTSPGSYRVVVDAQPELDGVPAPPFRDSLIEHRLKDTFSFRLGGSYHLPLGEAPGASRIILRGGVAYDTRAAEDGWLRADLDGAARHTLTVGAAYRAQRYEVNLGAGYVHEGKNTNAGSCNPTSTMEGCSGNGSESALDERSGPDPINPLVVPDQQAESPVNQGTIESNYLLFMVGVSTWF
ncbi:MAG TPA: outer membrane protein transport protein [Kofleriaceae bacterium]|nr:outer membrane protein transport protein [Kofleriaceae bacterium]